MHALPEPETNPTIMTFSNINSENPTVKFIDATRTISELPLIKLVDTPDKLVFIEGNGDPYFTLHTIYKDSSVSTYGKQVDLLGFPSGVPWVPAPNRVGRRWRFARVQGPQSRLGSSPLAFHQLNEKSICRGLSSTVPAIEVGLN